MMTKERKKAQDKLRRNYGYSTSDNNGRGTILYKTDNKGVLCRMGTDNCKVLSDLIIYMNKRILTKDKPIQIEISQYKDNGETYPIDKRFENINSSYVFLSLEELDLLHTIAHQMADENDWESQLKQKPKVKHDHFLYRIETLKGK